MRASRLLLATLLASSATLLLATGGSSSVRSARAHAEAAPVTGTWVGRLRGDQGFVAIVSDGTQVVAYVCDDGRLGSWFANPVSGANIQLAGAWGHDDPRRTLRRGSGPATSGQC